MEALEMVHQKEFGKCANGLENGITDYSCTYCCIKFTDMSALRAHCQTSRHQTVIMSDEGHAWKFRPPPRGLQPDQYNICESYENLKHCRYGAQCIDAHSWEEFSEWKERFEFRRLKVQQASEVHLFGKSYTETLLEKWSNASNPDLIMNDHIEDVEDVINGDLKTSVSSKNSQREWTFLLKTQARLRAVALLQDAHRAHFSIRQISTAESGTMSNSSSWRVSNDQEWLSSSDMMANYDINTVFEHRIRVVFKTDIYGTFRQSIVFDFGNEPVLVKHLCVDVVPIVDTDKAKDAHKATPHEVQDMLLSSSERWCADNSEIVEYTSSIVLGAGMAPTSPPQEFEKERRLLDAYPTPRPETFTLSQSTVLEKTATRANYRTRVHELLYVEEMARYEQVARYNITTKLQIANCYLLAPNGMANSTAKYAHNGELFALMHLGREVSEDTSAGRLILNNCSTVFVSSPSKKTRNGEINKRTVYEAIIEDKGKSTIYLRLSAATVTAFSLRSDCMFSCQVQFQLNRIPYCEWHYAIDRIADFNFLFPDTVLEPSIPWSPRRQWNDLMDTKLNLKQREAVIAITSPSEVSIPPILIIGPFGTGKTYTLAQAIKQLLIQPESRVLVCSHSNSAADLYIKDYLHPWVEAGHADARPLRVYYHKRWVATVNQVVQKYCLIEMVNGHRTFKIPTLDDILKHKIVVVTLNMSIYLSSLGLKKGHFTHILLDEAAQAMECEAIMPLALADKSTRIVLAGDHMQLSPELFSQFAKDRNLHVSLLERLYDHYPNNFPCKVLLCENYRAHEAIINFTSELFYDQKLVSSGRQPRHDKFYPLTFFTARGEDVQEPNSTAFYNTSEVYEVVERVSELRKKWPSAWGRLEEHSIGIMTPYADQVFHIRAELRKRRMSGVSVERVLNVQGKQFRAIFLSTVRTRRTCRNESVNELDFGFLSNWKLLNTAITRAQSLVAVVGDPIALCSVGRCRKVWERFIEICSENQSLFGITWSGLRSQLDGVELKKSYTLNPLAPEFVPRALQNESYIKLPPILGNFNGNVMPSFVPGPLYYYPPMPSQNGVLFPINRPAPNIGIPYHIGAPNPWPPPFNSNCDINKDDKHLKCKNSLLMDLKPLLQNLPNIEPTIAPPNILLESFMRPIQLSGLCAENTNEPVPAQLQFLNNIHFPETQQQLPPRPPLPLPPQPPAHLNDWQLLLPPNTTLAEVLSSKTLQMEWYRHLISSAGLDVASRFKDLVILASQKRAAALESQQQIHMQTMESIAEMAAMKPLLLRDLETAMLNQMQQNQTQQPLPHSMPLFKRQFTEMGHHQFLGSAFPSSVGGPTTLRPPTQSLPLTHPHNASNVATQQNTMYLPNNPQSRPMTSQVSTPAYINDFHLNGREQDIEEASGGRPNNAETTYASVLRAQPARNQSMDDVKITDPLGILKSLARSSNAPGSNGLYQYFA